MLHWRPHQWSCRYLNVSVSTFFTAARSKAEVRDKAENIRKTMSRCTWFTESQLLTGDTTWRRNVHLLGWRVSKWLIFLERLHCERIWIRSWLSLPLSINTSLGTVIPPLLKSSGLISSLLSSWAGVHLLLSRSTQPFGLLGWFHIRTDVIMKSTNNTKNSHCNHTCQLHNHQHSKAPRHNEGDQAVTCRGVSVCQVLRTRYHGLMKCSLTCLEALSKQLILVEQQIP